MTATEWRWVFITWGAMLFSVLVFAASIYVLISVPNIPNKWDGAIALKACSNVLIVRRTDNTVWAIREWGRPYRVEDEQTVC
jgi:hypothetical protein